MSRPDDCGVEEVDYSYEFCIRRTARNLAGWPLVSFLEGEAPPVGELLERFPGIGGFLFVLAPEVVVPRAAALLLLWAVGDGRGHVVLPVCNESAVPQQRASIPAPYHDFDNLEELARLFEESYGREFQSIPVSRSDLSVAFISSRLMAEMPSDLPCGEVAEWLRSRWKGSAQVAKGALVHRFGDYYGSIRTDLVELVPEGARVILDVGCARGATGRAVRERLGMDVQLIGVELNPVMAAEARKAYDQVLEGDVAEVPLPTGIDVVIMGDVLEHMRRPDLVLRRLARHLAPGGVVVGSVPNAGHWSVVTALLRGEFEYIPVGLNCISHVRCFTARSLEAMMEQAGLQVVRLLRDMPEPLPSGLFLIEAVRRLGLGDEESLRTVELRFVAKRAD